MAGRRTPATSSMLAPAERISPSACRQDRNSATGFPDAKSSMSVATGCDVAASPPLRTIEVISIEEPAVALAGAALILSTTRSEADGAVAQLANETIDAKPNRHREVRINAP